jgi:hypothetical protein
MLQSHKGDRYSVFLWTIVVMRTALFWVITQRAVVIPYRRFGTSCRYRLKGSRAEDEADRLSQNVGKEFLLLAA